MKREILFEDAYVRRDDVANDDLRSGRLLVVRGNPEPNERVIIVHWLEALQARVEK